MRETDIVTGRYLAEKIREWLRANPKKSQADLAKLAGLSTAQISILLSTGRGAGRKTLRGIGKVLGVTPDTIEAEAMTWAAARGVKQPARKHADLPNRELAISLLINAGRITEETVNLVRAMSSPIDLDEDLWIAVLLSVERRTAARSVA